MIIRKYNSTDLNSCRLLWTEMVQQHRDIYNDQSIGGDNPGLEFDSHLKLVGAENIFIAEIDGIPVGFTSLIKKGEEAEIEPVIIGRENRGKKTGEQLIKFAIEEARKSKILCLYVKPVARNKDAVSFFHKCGFNILGHIQQFMWLGDSDQDTWKDGIQIFGKKFKY